jgi:uncharacterized protein (DUF58 family)
MESARHVDWKASAHTGDLQVREFAREQDLRVLIHLDLDLPYSSDAWFESAVECCAFLAFRLAERGVHIRFRTQELDVSLPEEGSIHTILKYLALVSPLQGKPLEALADAVSFQVVFSANPARLESPGWVSSRVVGPDAFVEVQ